MARGTLRIYLGAAPGVGKTCAMLSEAHRRAERGTDVVVALVEHHARPRTEAMLHGLEQLPRRELEHGGGTCAEMDVDAVLRRAPAVALAVTSLRSDDVEWSPEDRAELLAAIEEGADRLDHLVGNLLDMSRLQTGTVRPIVRGADLDEVVPMALGGVPEGSAELDVPETLPIVLVDTGLAERVVANLVENAVKYSPPGRPVLVSASALGDRVEVRVVDRGPGVPDEAKERIFEPFQRYGDSPRGAGVGLGLAVARGFAEAMGGTLEAEDTPGGGLTMVLTVRAATPRPGRPDGAPAADTPTAPPGAARGPAAQVPPVEGSVQPERQAS
jgi:two-component system, OmpR family, sensor histidine kinase KdpD